jgi:hypothetical protein
MVDMITWKAPALHLTPMRRYTMLRSISDIIDKQMIIPLTEQGVRHHVAPLFSQFGERLFVCSKGGTMNILIFFLCISLIANLLLVRALIKLRRYIGSFTRLVEGMRNIENNHHP